MGKTTRWLKSLVSMKKHHDKDKNTPKTNNINNSNDKRTNLFSKEYTSNETEKEKRKHAIAVATATAAAADAAVAAAQAAMAAARLTSQGRGTLFCSTSGTFTWAATKIQSFFRGYLARRALRALKGLVKLQAHVRGFLVRKRADATLQSMLALVRAQARVRSQVANQALTKHNKFLSEHLPRKSIERIDEAIKDQFHSKRLSTSSYVPYNSYEGSPKIVEIDTFKPKSRSKRINPSTYDFYGDDFQYPTMSAPLPFPVPSRLSMPECPNINHHGYFDLNICGDDFPMSSTQSTPRLTNSQRTGGSPTPTKSMCGDRFFRPHNHPSYMADTESFRAKSRSHSAPKQRPEGRSKKGYSLDEIMATKNSICGVKMQRSCQV